MNNNFVNLVDLEISLILEFLFGSIIELNGNTEALGFRLICKKFRQVLDRLAHISITVPISKRKKRRNYRLPSEISSISMITKYSGYEITKQDWESVFGDGLSNVESSLRYLHVDAYLINYLPKFKYLRSILWEVGGGHYDLLKEIPHKELIITRCDRITPYGSIAHLTRLREIEIIPGMFLNYKLIDKYLPSTILRMTIDFREYEVDVIDLSKFSSLEYLEIVALFEGQVIEELILPYSLYEFHSSVKIKKMNLHECKKLEVLELRMSSKWDITIPYLPNLYNLIVDSLGGSYSIDTRTLMRIKALNVVVIPQHNAQWSIKFDGLDSYIKTSCATKLIPVCSNLAELMMEFKDTVERTFDIKDLVLSLDIKNETLDYITGVGFDKVVVVIKSHRQINCIDIDTDELNVVHEKK